MITTQHVLPNIQPFHLFCLLSMHMPDKNEINGRRRTMLNVNDLRVIKRFSNESIAETSCDLEALNANVNVHSHFSYDFDKMIVCSKHQVDICNKMFYFPMQLNIEQEISHHSTNDSAINTKVKFQTNAFSDFHFVDVCVKIILKKMINNQIRNIKQYKQIVPLRRGDIY